MAEKVIELRRSTWKNGSTEKKWRGDVEAIPFAQKRVDEIQREHVLEFLAPIWTTQNHMARRRLTTIRATFEYAVAAGHRSDDPTQSLKGVLKPVQNGVRHLKALEHGEVAGALDMIANYGDKPGTRKETALLLTFVAHTAVRAGEAAGARWSEIDANSNTWIVPAERTKVNEVHRVPLALAARLILAEARELNPDSEYIFPARSGGRISGSAWGAFLKAAGVQAVTHGFRTSFRSWAADTGVAHEVAEASLGHKVGSAVVRSYQRSDVLRRRTKVMAAWSDYLSG